MFVECHGDAKLASRKNSQRSSAGATNEIRHIFEIIQILIDTNLKPMKATQQSLRNPRPSPAAASAGSPRILLSLYSLTASSCAFFSRASVAYAAGRGSLRLFLPQLWSCLHRSQRWIRDAGGLSDFPDSDALGKARRHNQRTRMQVTVPRVAQFLNYRSY
jgi:hypothetical protein